MGGDHCDPAPKTTSFTTNLTSLTHPPRHPLEMSSPRSRIIRSQPLPTRHCHNGSSLARVPSEPLLLPPYDSSLTSNLLSLLSLAPWSRDSFHASNVPPTHLHPRSSERWVFTSYDESIFEGTWNRYTYSPNKPGGAEVLYRLHSKLSQPTQDETAIEFFGARYATSLAGDTIARRGVIIQWLGAMATFKKMPRPTPSSGDWILDLVPEACAFTLFACTADSRGRILKPLLRVQATLRGMEILLFYDRPSLSLFYDPPRASKSSSSEPSPTLMDMEMGLVNFVVLYFAKMKFEPMPPPPLPLKAQEILMREFEEEMGSSDEDSDDDDDYLEE